MMLVARSFAATLAKGLALCGVMGLVLAAVPLGRAADADAPRRPRVAPGYCRFPGTISPNNAYVFAWMPTGLTPEQKASLKEWPRDLEINSDEVGVENYLFDAAQGRPLLLLPDFDYFEGQGSRKNRGALEVAWAPDSHCAIAICQERWDDNGIAWVEPAANRVTNIKAELEHTYGAFLHQRHKEKPEEMNMQFSNPAILPGDILFVDANGGHMKEGPYYDYRLICHVRIIDGKPRIELIKAQNIAEDEHTTGVDYDPDLNKYYTRLRAKLTGKPRAALEEQERAWIQWRDSQPEEARAQLTERRASELHARLEM